MARIRFTANIQRHVSCPDAEVAGDSVRTVLETYFAEHPAARSYVLDDQGALRKHMNVFVDGAMIADREGLGDPVSVDAAVDVLQALSGG